MNPNLYLAKKSKTPLRYPGGKSKATKFLFADENMPINKIKEYREPFIGGGSPAVAFARRFPEVPIWINDKYYNLYCFWLTLQKQGKLLHDSILKAKMTHDVPEKAKELFNQCKEEISNQEDPFEIAWRFYIINKCSFSGLTENSTFSELSSIRNWTLSNIDSLQGYHILVRNWKITNLDYTELLSDDQDVFVFLDPPYDLKKDYSLSGADTEKLYGTKGSMHKGFNHTEFAENLNKHQSMMMVTYNSNPNIRKLFEGWNQTEWDLTYSMNNGSKRYEEAQKDRKELLCVNYDTKSINTLEEFFV
jgi:DNA adenine methylase